MDDIEQPIFQIGDKVRHHDKARKPDTAVIRRLLIVAEVEYPNGRKVWYRQNALVEMERRSERSKKR